MVSTRLRPAGAAAFREAAAAAGLTEADALREAAAEWVRRRA